MRQRTKWRSNTDSWLIGRTLDYTQSVIASTFGSSQLNIVCIPINMNVWLAGQPPNIQGIWSQTFTSTRNLEPMPCLPITTHRKYWESRFSNRPEHSRKQLGAVCDFGSGMHCCPSAFTIWSDWYLPSTQSILPFCELMLLLMNPVSSITLNGTTQSTPFLQSTMAYASKQEFT